MLLGSASITVNSSCSGNPEIAWSTLEIGPSINNLVAGNYSVTITDETVCGDTIINFEINSGASFVVGIIPYGEDFCAGSATLTAEIMGANPADVSFQWNDPAMSTSQSILVADGTYTCTAIYGTCVDEDSYTVVGYDFEFEVIYNDAICTGGNGSANINVIMGSGAYMYEWSTGNISPGIQFNEGGDYSVTVTDIFSTCEDSHSFLCTELPAVEVS